jgi:hypothetical protein
MCVGKPAGGTHRECRRRPKGRAASRPSTQKCDPDHRRVRRKSLACRLAPRLSKETHSHENSCRCIRARLARRHVGLREVGERRRSPCGHVHLIQGRADRRAATGPELRPDDRGCFLTWRLGRRLRPLRLSAGALWIAGHVHFRWRAEMEQTAVIACLGVNW